MSALNKRGVSNVPDDGDIDIKRVRVTSTSGARSSGAASSAPSKTRAVFTFTDSETMRRIRQRKKIGTVPPTADSNDASTDAGPSTLANEDHTNNGISTEIGMDWTPGETHEAEVEPKKRVRNYDNLVSGFAVSICASSSRIHRCDRERYLHGCPFARPFWTSCFATMDMQTFWVKRPALCAARWAIHSSSAGIVGTGGIYSVEGASRTLTATIRFIESRSVKSSSPLYVTLTRSRHGLELISRRRRSPRLAFASSLDTAAVPAQMPHPLRPTSRSSIQTVYIQ